MSESSSYYIKKVQFTNFRCFSELTISFDKNITVLVAPNGGGKTAVLDGLSLSLRLFVDSLEENNSSKGFSTKDIRLILSQDRRMETLTPVCIKADGVFGDKNISWSRERQSPKISRTNTVDAKDLKKCAGDLLKQYKTELKMKKTPDVVFPLISYYGTGRLWSEVKPNTGKKTDKHAINKRQNGYTDCLSPSSHYKYFTDWFRRFSYDAKKESPEQKESPHEPMNAILAVRKAVNTTLSISGWQDPEWDFAEDCIVASHNEYGRLPVDTLSDGIRNMTGLVADIAHRAYRLNPQFKERAAELTPGIILIDEVDMHLHPQWQQIVIRSLREAFPLIQFIVTTHSPQVLTTLRKENIRILSEDHDGQWTAEIPERSPLARESGDALAYIMGSDPRPDIPGINESAQEYEQLVKRGMKNSEKAIKIKQFLEDSGFEFHEAEEDFFNFLESETAGNQEKS
ncbi:MAG: AAA family ATPase [Firmicutes bacterium]|nr:AAA family ATPase [Bacillota bacterium]